jgi:hypothetical protein
MTGRPKKLCTGSEGRCKIHEEAAVGAVYDRAYS